ncbi:MAG: ABC transporter substrate-binding protein [Candidatus Levyibacteriota bacterium]|nr:MAG: ABC transporter substrate-binding protein [Candidatus Levybacteria bacterium]
MIKLPIKYIFATFIVLLGLVGLFLLQNRKPAKPPIETPKLTAVTLALDYTPNTNHTGIYVAQKKGYYKNEGIEVKILPYSGNVSSEILVSTNKADVGVSYTEGVVTSVASGNPVVSIATIIRHNTSSLAATENSGIKTPKDLDGKIYGGFGAPFENAVISEMIKKNNGKGNFKTVMLDIDGIKALETKKIDFVWIFDAWTGVQAKRQGVKLVSFSLIKYGIPDYYTPVLISGPTQIKGRPEILRKFIKATTKGYNFAIQNPEESAQILIDSAQKGMFDDKEFVVESQKYLSPRYTDPDKPWGVQDEKAWTEFPKFILSTGQIKDASGSAVTTLDFTKLYTNQFFK